MVKTVHILGATGSIGQSAADVIASAADRFDVGLLTAHTDAQGLADVARRLKARRAVIADETQFATLRAALDGSGTEALAGREALREAAGQKADITIAAIMGLAGLEPLMSALAGSRSVAIANKEPLVAAGPQVLGAAARHQTQILPLDSEHNAIFQVFNPAQRSQIDKMILTASGGPFRTWSAAQMKDATPEQALAHPNWSMGRKITIDCATMMNKALEVVEAHYLFAMPPKKIDILVHPQSVVHSLVEYCDGSVLAQLGAHDMRTPLSHVLGWPERLRTPGQRLDLKTLKHLDFEPADPVRFPALKTVYACLEAGQAACIALNAANEVAVEAFLTNRIGFADIMNCVHDVLDKTDFLSINTLEDVARLDRVSRDVAHKLARNRAA